MSRPLAITESYVHDRDKHIFVIRRKYENGFEWTKELNQKTGYVFFSNSRGESYLKKSDGSFYSDSLGLTVVKP